MLKQLSIENFILIRSLYISFNNGFTAITGETGAGKTIFLDALGLLLGDRADGSILSDKNKKCIIEGEFDISFFNKKKFFQNNDLEYNDLCIFRREILPQGRSRAFINDTPVNVALLKTLGEELIDIHSQHSTMMLAKPAFHLLLIDSIANTKKEYSEFQKLFIQHKKLSENLNQLKINLSNSEKEKDYYNFLLSEITELSLQPNEKNQMEEELSFLQNAEKIQTVVSSSNAMLDDSENSIINKLNKTILQLSDISQFFSKAGEFSERLNSCKIEIEDIATELSGIDFSSSEMSKIQLIEDRLNKIYHLLHKHKVKKIEELVELQREFQNKINETDYLSKQIDETEKELEKLHSKLVALSKSLSKQRNSVIPKVEKKITSIIQELGMPNGKFEIKNDTNNAISIRGIDDIKFYFAANKGDTLQELMKTASGGELSRIMLALKSVIAEVSQLPTLIFDEIDTGTSGEIAKKMANIFQNMGKTMQLLVITHLPQVAAKATNHIKVYKTETENTTFSNLKIVANKDRAEEIAKMVAGEKISSASIKTAEELMN